MVNNGLTSMSKRLDEKTWQEVEESLRETIPHYERVNSAITFGLSGKMRELLLDFDVPNKSTILDAGCGPGELSELILRKCPDCRVICMDPLPDMLKAAALRLGNRVELLRGVFEDIPLEEGSVDMIMASYSFRDAIDKEAALQEFRRVLKPGGRLMILDLAKPDNRILSTVIGLYIRFLVPVISAVLIGRWNSPWKALYKTYKHMLTSKELTRLIGRYFEVEERLSKFGVAFTIVRARKV